MYDYKLAIEVDENGHSHRSIDFEIKRQKVIEEELTCEFIRIDYDKESSNNPLTNWLKTLTDKISMRLLELELKSDNTIKSNDIK